MTNLAPRGYAPSIPDDPTIKLLKTMLSQIESLNMDQQLLRAGVENDIAQIRATVDTQVWLLSSQAAALRREVNNRVRTLLPEQDDYRKFSKKLFSSLWNDLKEVFQVPQYREIPRTRFESAMQFVREWYPHSSVLTEEARYEQAS